MPLFGKKEKSSPENAAKTAGKPAYPTQAAYPTQGSYPTQNYSSGAVGSGAPMAAPPPYYAVNQPPVAAYPPVAGATVTYHQPMAGPPPYPVAGGGYPVYQYSAQPPPQTVVVQGGFDAGARFDANAKPTVPPPPPGVMLHPAQMAAMQGSNVVVTQKPGNFWAGGSDGGYTIF